MTLDVLRLISVVMVVVVMILLPFALHVRRPTHGWGWAMVAAIELAWAENGISTIRRFGEPWDWLISPFLFMSALLAFVYILRADKVENGD